MAFNQPFPVASPLMQKPPPPPTFGPDLAVRLICPECREPNPDIREEFGSGDLVCGMCGLVLGDRIIDTRSEWRTFANDEGDDPRVSERPRTSPRGYEQLDTTISDIAKQLYKRVHDEGVLKGKPQEAITGACIFIACRQAHVPRTFREFCDLTHVLTFNLAPGASTNPQRARRTSSPLLQPADLPTYVHPVSIGRRRDILTCHLLGKPKSLREISSAASVSGGDDQARVQAVLRCEEKLVKEKWIQDGKARLDRLPFDGK
ncbi:transcription factor TFIIB repeat-domain-containing protein [Schizophyllum amplum]|uniref:General transcription factor TFIIB n=1 Tax=Schizophyllum amplum TaxID=97359 RepID=A0A550C386_9AGAR|nr:transcription factor TFIIB repeat-domain-containing protein [Auriculariopsis ampla]